MLDTVVMQFYAQVIELQFSHVNGVLVEDPNNDGKFATESAKDKPLSIPKLVAKNLLKFTIPPNTSFVVNQQHPNQEAFSLTGFVNSSDHLEGYGL